MFKIYFEIGRKKKKKPKKKKKEIEKIKCENSKSVYSRFLGDFYSHGTF